MASSRWRYAWRLFTEAPEFGWGFAWRWAGWCEQQAELLRQEIHEADRFAAEVAADLVRLPVTGMGDER